MQALQTKLESLNNQNSDCKQHIDVLKESLNAKEQRANTLQTEVSPNTHAPSRKKTHRQPYDLLVRDMVQTGRFQGKIRKMCVACAGRDQSAWWGGWGWRWASIPRCSLYLEIILQILSSLLTMPSHHSQEAVSDQIGPNCACMCQEFHREISVCPSGAPQWWDEEFFLILHFHVFILSPLPHTAAVLI